MSAPLLLTFNPGSSSVKIGLFHVSSEGATRVGQGSIDFRHTPLSLHLVNGDTIHDIALKAAVTENLHEVLDETLNWFATHFSLTDLVAVGHRVVHGATRFPDPSRLPAKHSRPSKR